MLFWMAAPMAAVLGFVVLTSPPARLALPNPTPDDSIAGIVHVHTNRSDGRDTPEEIAAAAARAGLTFVVFTDHGDATRMPDLPVYRNGVLCLDAVEISTTGGHYLALDMPPSPYPLGGEARDVAEDVRRLGGFGVAAHPDSPKAELRWREWFAPVDGIELINPDTSWRVWAQSAGWRPRFKLFAALVDYPFRPAESIASLLGTPSDLRFRWDALTRRRRVVLLAGIDAHGMVALRDAAAGGTQYSLPLPSYEASFRTLSLHVRPDRPLVGDAASDAASVFQAIRAGHLYIAVDGLASPPSFEFTATNAGGTVREGDEMRSGGPVTLQIRSNAPATFTTTVMKGLEVIAGDRHEQEFSVEVPGTPAVYWVEITSNRGKTPVPWISSNPIYVRGSQPTTGAPVRPPATESRPLRDARTATGWHVEHDSTSLAALDVVGTADGGSELRFRYGLSGGSVAGQFAALVVDTPGGAAPYDRLTFTARGEHPMRISVQLRRPTDGPVGERWQRSVYIDATDQERTVYFDDLTPLGDTGTYKPVLEEIRSVLFVVDTANTKPGSSNRVWIKRAALQK